jgi:hypothetical protein
MYILVENLSHVKGRVRTLHGTLKHVKTFNLSVKTHYDLTDGR